MARRNGRKGAWLATDDYTGFTVYASKLQRDFWGSLAVKPLQRNLQEISSPLNDPVPVPFYRGPNYEQSSMTLLYVPQTVGNTSVLTSVQNAAIQTPGLYPNVTNGHIIAGIGTARIGSTFIVT